MRTSLNRGDLESLADYLRNTCCEVCAGIECVFRPSDEYDDVAIMEQLEDAHGLVRCPGCLYWCDAGEIELLVCERCLRKARKHEQ